MKENRLIPDEWTCHWYWAWGQWFGDWPSRSWVQGPSGSWKQDVVQIVQYTNMCGWQRRLMTTNNPRAFNSWRLGQGKDKRQWSVGRAGQTCFSVLAFVTRIHAKEGRSTKALFFSSFPIYSHPLGTEVWPTFYTSVDYLGEYPCATKIRWLQL